MANWIAFASSEQIKSFAFIANPERTCCYDSWLRNGGALEWGKRMKSRGKRVCIDRIRIFLAHPLHLWRDRGFIQYKDLSQYPHSRESTRRCQRNSRILVPFTPSVLIHPLGFPNISNHQSEYSHIVYKPGIPDPPPIFVMSGKGNY